MKKHVFKYNPALLSEEELIDTFVVRSADLNSVVQIIRENTTGSNQHVLVIGPRGMGKTTLVLRVAAEIRRDQALNTLWYPLVFSEESYEVVTAGEFWLETLFHLSEQTGDERWKKTYDELKLETDDQRLSARALGQLLDFSDSQKKRVLLVVENLNMLVSDMTSLDEAWKIRHTLVNEPRLMLLASATSRFEHFENAGQAMFEMFRMIELSPLDDLECNAIWEMITGEKLMGQKIRPLRILTGGNPRLMTIIAKFSAQRSFARLLDDLVGLIDDHTEYFKSHLDNLPAIERKVYLALAELWDFSTAREIASAARLDINKTSSLLNRLTGKGAVTVKATGKRTKLYGVAERMYNIYYLMRRRGKPEDRVRAAVKFMVSMYDPESATKMIIDEACKRDPEACKDHYLAFKEVLKSVPDPIRRDKILQSAPQHFLEKSGLDDGMIQIIDSGKEGEAPDKLSSQEKIKFKEWIKRLREGASLGKAGEYELSLDLFDKIIEEIGNYKKTFSPLAIAVLINKGNSLAGLVRFEEAIKAYDEVIKRYSGHRESRNIEQLATALYNKGLSLENLNQFEEAIKAYDEVINLYSERQGIEIDELMSTILLNKGDALGNLGRSEEAIKVYDEIIERYSERQEGWAFEKVACAILNKGVRWGDLGRSEEAIKVYDEVIERYSERRESGVVDRVGNALINKGVTLGELGRSEEAIDVFNAIIERYSGHQEPEIIELLAIALYNKGITFRNLGYGRQAEDAFREAIQRNSEFLDAYLNLIDLKLKKPETQAEALMLAEDLIKKKPDDAELLNKIAFFFYAKGLPTVFQKCETWARRAVSLSPDDLHYKHTLACILSAQGKGAEALSLAGEYVSDADLVEKTLEDAIELFVELGASGHAKEALDLIHRSPAAKHLEPLVEGLKIYLGEEVNTAVEILEVAKDVVKRIEDRKEKRDSVH